MKPEMKPNVKATLQKLEVGQNVEFNLYQASENTIRSTATRLTKKGEGVFRTHKNGIYVKVTRLS